MVLVVHRIHHDAAQQTAQLFVRPSAAAAPVDAEPQGGAAQGTEPQSAAPRDQEELDAFVTASLQSGRGLPALCMATVISAVTFSFLCPLLEKYGTFYREM
eukprot:SAG31_NODE_533_length_14371_cov_6.455367_17_plen_101_part_00